MSQKGLSQILAPLDNQKDMAKHPLPMKPCNVAIVGKAGCGKSSLILNLIMKKKSPWYKHFDLIFLVSPTARGDPKFEGLVEDLEDQDQYYDTLDNDVLQDIIDKMDAHLEEWKNPAGRAHAKKKRKSDPNYIIIYDDVIHLLKGKKSRLVDMLVTQNRHRKLTNVFLLQKWNTYMSPLIRTNLGCIAMFYTGNEKELSSFIDEMSDDEKKVRRLYEYATLEPYSFLWVNQYGTRPAYYKRFDPIIYRKRVAPNEESKDNLEQC